MDADHRIDRLLALVELPEVLDRIQDERPAFHEPRDDARIAHYLAREGADAFDLTQLLAERVLAAGFEMELCERNEFFYTHGDNDLAVSIDAATDSVTHRFDHTGRERGSQKTWATIPTGRIVVTFTTP